MTNRVDPAFPYNPSQQIAGMTLRDYFAAKAMQSLMLRGWEHYKGTVQELYGTWAVSSYAVADAMLKAREAKHD